jgi:hypothetical protein
VPSKLLKLDESKPSGVVFEDLNFLIIKIRIGSKFLTNFSQIMINMLPKEVRTWYEPGTEETSGNDFCLLLNRLISGNRKMIISPSPYYNIKRMAQMYYYIYFIGVNTLYNREAEIRILQLLKLIQSKTLIYKDFAILIIFHLLLQSPPVLSLAQMFSYFFRLL